MEICEAPTLQLKALNKHSINTPNVHRDGKYYRGMEPTSSAYQPNALPLGQIGARVTSLGHVYSYTGIKGIELTAYANNSPLPSNHSSLLPSFSLCCLSVFVSVSVSLSRSLLSLSLSPSLSLSVCLSLSLSVFVSVYFCLCLSLSLCLCLSVSLCLLFLCLSVSLSLSLSSLSVSLYLCLCLSVRLCLSDCLSVCLSFCFCLCLSVSVCLSLSLSVCVSLSPYQPLALWSISRRLRAKTISFLSCNGDGLCHSVVNIYIYIYIPRPSWLLPGSA